MKPFLILLLSLGLAACGDASFQRERTSDRGPAPDAQEEETSTPIPETTPPESSDQLPEKPDPTSTPPVEGKIPPEALHYPGRTGPYAVTTYTENLADPGYNSAIVYYPTDPKAIIIGASSGPPSPASWM